MHARSLTPDQIRQRLLDPGVIGCFGVMQGDTREWLELWARHLGDARAAPANSGRDTGREQTRSDAPSSVSRPEFRHAHVLPHIWPLGSLHIWPLADLWVAAASADVWMPESEIM